VIAGMPDQMITSHIACEVCPGTADPMSHSAASSIRALNGFAGFASIIIRTYAW
jgi:hypothetical protein